ncbi:unnamed protein product [Cylicocyclus nassatus]|uniref:Receptor L-domain domain-containing protein n=1 Tax=Cylicocyclus nassatus TaxID=53992 RepID=A0AA36M9L2_CYLNA|nr:unnamed protein product [Cylicocyclus nassatus]
MKDLNLCNLKKVYSAFNNTISIYNSVQPDDFYVLQWDLKDNNVTLTFSQYDICDEFIYTEEDEWEDYEEKQGLTVCRKLSGGLTIEGFHHMPDSPTFNFFSSLTEINGPVTLKDNKGFESFYFLKNLRIINASLSKEAPLTISGNKGLTCLGFDNLAHIYGGHHATIEVQNYLPLCDIDILRNSFTGKINYIVESEPVDDTALGVALIIGGLAILSSIVYGSSYAIYRWEEKQEKLREQGYVQVAGKKHGTTFSKDDNGRYDKKD